MRRSPFLLPLVACVLATTAWARAPVPARTAADSTAEARTLVRWALEALADSSVEARQRAVGDLERAIRLDPDGAIPWLVLGRAYELGGYRELARDCYRNSIRRAPREPDGHMELAMAWKREWLHTLNPGALDRAIGELDTVTRLRPYGADAWLRLVPLRYDRGDPAGAAAAAERALAGRPRRPGALLAVAYVAYRRGDLERADSLFAAAIPRLDPTLRNVFDHPSWIGLSRGRTPADTVRTGPPGGPWAGLDPDPTTRENELQLEYWSRVAHAYFVYYDPLRPELDARAETYVRYGPPRSLELNPLSTSTSFQYYQYSAGQKYSAPAEASPADKGRRDLVWDYPLDAQVWSYPDLGMRVVLHDQSLQGRYTPAAAREFDPGSLPNQRLLAERGDVVSLGGGLAVFPTLPPREQRLDLRGTVARFEGDRRPRLLAQVQAPGEPGDTLWARCAVLDSTGRVVSRDSSAFTVSACDPTERRLAEFSSELPAGVFQVAVSVRGTHRRRGLFRTATVLAPPTHALALSDVVLACGNPSSMPAESAVRLEANIDARVVGSRPLVAYFEIYRLASGADGLARFEYEYTVRRFLEPPTGLKRLFFHPEARVLTSASREESHVGALRRQFVVIPTQSLPAGRYRLEIRVRDLVARTEVQGATGFVRE